ncbi:MAG: beta-propeller fold lactonase family protein [Anaerolineae bacterium]|nr:beta-propeller fold lactonase family protein [Anaerolineae bacterium]
MRRRSGILILLLAVSAFLPRGSLPAHTQLAPAATAKSGSSLITLTPDGQTLLVANPDSHSLSIVDVATLTVLAEVPAGVQPRSVTVSGDGRLAYVANHGSDSISVVDLEQHVLVAGVAVGYRPAGIALSPGDRFLAVAEMGADTVRFLDATTLATLSMVATGDRPYGLAFTPDGQRLLVSHLLSGDVTLLPVRPYRLLLPAIASQAPVGAAWNLETSARAAAPPSIIHTWPNVAPAPAVLVNAAGTRAYLPQTMAHGQGLNVQFDNTVFPKISVVNLETDSHQTSEHISLPEVDQPVGLPWDAALKESVSELWVVNAASNDLSIIDVSTPTVPARAGHIPVADNPRGIVLSPDGNTAYVANSLAGTVSVIDTATYTVTATVHVTEIPLPPLLLHGKRLFHSSARPELAQARWIACNTCHVEGEHDGRTWLLQYTGEIPPGGTPVITRNTTSLLGMIETYPLRWSAEWDESADSEFSIRFEQFGSGLIDGEMYPTVGAPNQGRSYDLDALAAFIDSLAIPPARLSLSAAASRGKALFASAETACASCHPPPLYTDLQTHDVGTASAPGEWFGPEIDTPTLRFLYDSAPYLHDGSAPTLLDVLTDANPDDQHGTTGHLSAEQLADLVAFLSSLPYR